MKKVISYWLLVICLFTGVPCKLFGQTLVFSNQTITVEASQLSLESVSFQPLEIVTNQVASWIPATTVVTNPPWVDNGSIVTNEVNQQVLTDVVSTNAASWTATVIFALPSGHQWELNGMPVTIERFKTRIEIPLDPASVQAAFGAASSGLEFAAQNGAYKPTGAVRDAFLGLAAQVLSRNQ